MTCRGSKIPHRNRIVSILLLLFFVTAVPLSATDRSYYIVGDTEQRKNLRELFDLLDQDEREETSPESRFIIIREIIRILRNAAETAKLNLFLTTFVEQHPEDPFDAYYLLVVAENHKESEAYPFAVHYFERILKNYTDLIYRGESVHFICLSNLIRLVEDPSARIEYYTELITRYSDMIDLGPTYFFLARTYGELGEWNQALKAYKNYLSYPAAPIPGVSDPRTEVEYMVKLADIKDKDWSMESLDELIRRIQSAIWSKRATILSRYMSKVSFFTRSWEQDQAEAEVDFLSNLGSFMLSTIRISPEIDTDSNTQEAYLRTRGWSYRIETWYLYFRRVYYPADPEIHGNWEWAGIYFGEKPFIGTVAGGTGR